MGQFVATRDLSPQEICRHKEMGQFVATRDLSPQEISQTIAIPKT
jgi:hypothetical protein